MVFITDLETKLKSKGLTPSSINLYLKNLKRLNDDMEIKNLNFLNKVEDIEAKLKDYKENTKRNYIISIVSALSVLKDEKKYSKLYKLWTTKMNSLVDEIKKKPSDVKSDKQKENWMNWDEVKEVYSKLEEEVNKFINNKQINDAQYNKLLEYMILSLFVLQPPRRNADYQKMNIVKEYSNVLPKDENYLIYDTNEFYFNNYKTKGTYNQQIIKFDDKLKDVIVKYLKFHPLIKGKKLAKLSNFTFLVYNDGKPLDKVNSITNILNKVFDKKIGASMLRNIYLTNKYADVKEEQKEDATKMGNSVNEQTKTYIKVDGK